MDIRSASLGGDSNGRLTVPPRRAAMAGRRISSLQPFPPLFFELRLLAATSSTLSATSSIGRLFSGRSARFDHLGFRRE
ncbi:unnamed protein product [Closterium sp. Yama58-4]|nr:unnamed protein product [Closterium sp. Yama58-4]